MTEGNHSNCSNPADNPEEEEVPSSSPTHNSNPNKTTPWDLEQGSTPPQDNDPQTETSEGVEKSLSQKDPDQALPTTTTTTTTDGAPSPYATVAEMKDSVTFQGNDRKDRLSSFWMLLTLAAIIATSGILSGSAATVIGAMIVAPLMKPILGVMLSVVLKDWKNLLDCGIILILGIGVSIGTGALFGLFVSHETFSKENNEQVASRVQPQLTDFFGALATGAVGAVALVRKDIAGALPGVSISISLVPPLCVAGLTLCAGEWLDASGALLLFVCNFMSIQFVGVIVMYIYKIHQTALSPNAKQNWVVLLTLGIMLAAIALPMGFTSRQITREREAEACIRDTIGPVVQNLGWNSNIVVARTQQNKLKASIVISGEPPFPDEEDLDDGKQLKELCPTIHSVTVTFIPLIEFEL